MKTFIRLANYLLAICLIVVAVILAYIAIPAFGNKALIVRSGSMEPTIKTGDLIVVRIAKGITSPQPNFISKYKVGDVIAFGGDNNPNVLTTHKIVAKQSVDGKTLYQTQGVANKSPDTRLIAEEKIIGKSILTLPKIGKLFAFAKTRQGFALLVLIPALLVIFIESINLIKELFKIIRARRMLQQDPESEIKNRNLLGPVGLRVLMPIVVSLMFFHNSYAYFSDSATSLNNTFTTASVFPTPTPTPTPSSIPTPTPTPSPLPINIVDHIVISEVQIDGGNGQDNDNDFIELYNPTSSPINLNGFRIVKRTGNSASDDNIFTFTSSHIIPPKGYFLWGHQIGGNNPNIFATTISADVFSSQTLAASNSVAIRQGALDTGSIIDAISWDPGASSLKEGTQFPNNPQENEGLERKAYSSSTILTMTTGADALNGNGFDSNDNASDFIIRPTSQPQNSSSSIETP